MQKWLQSVALTAVLGATAWSVSAQTTVPSAAAQAPLETAADQSKDTENKRLIAEAQAKLAWALIERLSEHGTNDPAISPASLASVFGIVAMGADTPMKGAIAKTLGFDAANAAKALAALSETHIKLAADNGGSFQSADKIVFAPDSPPNALVQPGLEKLKIDYSIDDLSKAEAVGKINAWVNEITKGAIPEILSGPLDKASFVALNALHFKDRWKTPFDKQLTAPAPFKGADGKSDDVAMMRLPEAERSYRSDKNFVGVDLPFADPRFSLVVITSTDKPLRAKEFGKVADWLSGTGFSSHKGDLALPRFRASALSDLLPVLDAMGLDKARHAPAALAAFGPGTVLSQVIQRAMVEVDEDGAEAAAATAVMASRSLERDDAIHMIVDKPFIFALHDHATGLILVAGYVGHAPKGKAE
jgi:serine protease inhibitor